MAEFFSRDYLYIWIVALAALLFFPVRQLIWALQVRRAQKRAGDMDEKELRLKSRSGFTAALLSLIFAYFYVNHLFSN